MGFLWDEPENTGWQNLAARLDEQTRFFWAIDSVSSAVSSALTTQDMLQHALGRITEATGARSGGIYVPQPEGLWTLVAGYNLPEDADSGDALALLDGAALQLALHSSEPVARSEHIHEQSQLISPEAHAVGIQSWATAPITALSSVWGVMSLFSHDYNAFSSAHLELLRVICQLLGLSISNTVVHEIALAQVDTQFQRQVAEMDTVLGNMSDGLIICDRRGLIVRANRAAARILGRPVSSLVGVSVLTEEWNRPPQSVGKHPSRDHWPLVRVIEQGGESITSLVEWNVDERAHVLNLTASPITRSGGKGEGAILLVRDVTEERMSEMMKEEFLGLLSHELRGPLTVISGYAQMLVRRLSRLDMREEVNYAMLIRENARRMSGMVGDLVDSSRLESGVQAIEKEAIDLVELVMSVAGRIGTEQSHARNFHVIEVDAEPDLPSVPADARRIDQVLTNLITNAIRYSPNGGPILVHVGRTPPDKRYQSTAAGHTGELEPTDLLVTVTDKGPGVTPEERKRIFERAYRGERAKEISAQGLGLGLYISRLAVEAHEGHIGVEDGPGGVGSAFWFTVPVE